MSITYGNPIVITSGTYDTRMAGNYKVNRVYWHQPNLQSSGLIITKTTASGNTLLEMGCEVSGQSQTMDFRSQWWGNPVVKQCPMGTVYIFTE